MKFSVKWLKEYVDIKCSTEELADQLNLAGLEVEGIDYVGHDLNGIVTAQIKEIAPHPDADKLQICQVFDGKETHQIVAGARNISVGDIVPLSLPGSVVAGGFKIKKAKLRGVPSSGMMCSAKELEAAEESDGIWILAPDTPLGIDFIEYGHLKDEVLDIGILPNRGDCQSLIGLAREISVILGTPLRVPPTDFKTTSLKVSKRPTISCETPQDCPLYSARILQIDKHLDTPLWMQRKLAVSGIRPISLLVDITNYVLLEMGQPLHAFDYDKLKTKTISVRLAKPKETFETLDNETRKLIPTDVLICDGDAPVALGGVMGGASSEVSDSTQTVLLESAFFHSTTIRKTAVRLGLHTESAIRFEKGVDIQGVIKASERAAHLYQTLAGATIHEEIYTFQNEADERFKQPIIPFSPDAINTLLGLEVPAAKQKEILETLGFGFENKSSVKVPSWRSTDIQETPCLAEEIARLFGYDKIPSRLPKALPVQADTSSLSKQVQSTKSILTGLGLTQAITFPMIGADDFEILGLKDNFFELENPLTPKESRMRPSLLPSLLKAVSHNLARQQQDVQLFEVGKTFYVTQKEDSVEPGEHTMVAGALTGNWIESPYLSEDKESNSVDFYKVKGVVETLLRRFGFTSSYTAKQIPSYMHPNQTAAISVNGVDVGFVGAVHPETRSAYNISQDLFYFECNLTLLNAGRADNKVYRKISKYPSTRRDVALVAPKDLPYSDIEKIIKTNRHPFVQEFFLFDYFESEKLGTDKKSLAIGFTYQNPEGTLEDDVVNKAHDSLKEALTKALPIAIRA